MPSTNTTTSPPSPRVPLAQIHPLPSALPKLQQHLLQTHLSPSSSYTQTSLFVQYALFTAIITALSLGALLPRYIPPDDLSALRILAYLLLGAGTSLIVLRVLIWVGARILWAFCEMDLGDGRGREKIRGESADGKNEMELTEGNLILGGLLG